eukprot:COSAG05_NODE_5106_length_1262_cov_1.147034_1_plen_78_part_00
MAGVCCLQGLALKLSIAAYARARDRSRVSPFVRRGVEAGCLDGAKVAAGTRLVSYAIQAGGMPHAIVIYAAVRAVSL